MTMPLTILPWSSNWKSYVAMRKWVQFISHFIQKVLTFLSDFHFYFQETNNLSNYQFLFQDLAITTIIGVTSKTSFKFSSQRCSPAPVSRSPCRAGPPWEMVAIAAVMRDLFAKGYSLQGEKEETESSVLSAERRCHPRRSWLVILLFFTKYRASTKGR